MTSNNKKETTQPVGSNEDPRVTGEIEIPKRPLVARVGLIVVILIVGVVLTAGVQMLRPTPEAAEPEMVVARTTGIRAEQRDVQTILRGYGTARSHRMTHITPQVGGVVLEINPRVETGNIIREGDLLFRIDPRDFELAVDSRQAEVQRLESELVRLEVEQANDERRLASAHRLRTIAQREYDRIERLVEESGAESQARLDSARSALEREEQAVIERENALALYESRHRSTEAQLATARSALAQARLDLDRTEVSAPFTGRVKNKNVEVGQKVGVGAEVLTLADDRILEIPVSLDSRDVARWLNVEADPEDVHWFNSFEDYPVRVRWTAVPDSRSYEGTLARIEDYNSQTRTFHVMARLDGLSSEQSDEINFPLTEGMFVEVEIPGRVARSVVAVPREAIDSQGNVFLSVNDALETRRVTVARFQDDMALISEGIAQGEIVLLRRPPMPVEGMTLEVTLRSDDTDYVEEALGEGIVQRLP